MKKLVKILSVVLLLVAFVLLFSCDEENGVCITGSGIINDYELSVDTFRNVSLSGPFNLRITQDNKQKLVVTADTEVYEEMKIEVKGETLEVGFKRNVNCYRADSNVWVNITVPDIDEVFISGTSEIVSEGDISLDALQITVSGVAEISLSGESNEQEISVSGTVNVNNFGLYSENVVIEVSGTGDFEVYAAELLDITVSGAATIKYKGTPVINQNASGIFELIDAN